LWTSFELLTIKQFTVNIKSDAWFCPPTKSVQSCGSSSRSTRFLDSHCGLFL